MKKLINHVDSVLAESLDGFAAAHADIVTLGADYQFVRRRDIKPGKVALISGGGSGHEPLHAGFVGRGMLDAACPGQIFTSPTPDQMLAAAEAVDSGAGVLFIVKNYSGDMMNFQMAAEMLDRENATVIVNDDVAVENSTYTTGRRGVAGTLIVEKIVGAAAERGLDLAQLKALGDATNKATASMGVALSSCTVPAAGNPTFQIGADEMEMGVGIHGEPGRRRVRLGSADDIAAELTGAVLKDLSLLARPAGAAAGQRLRRHAAAGAVPDGAGRAQGAGRRRGAGGAPSDGVVRDLAGDGRLLDHRVRARCRGPGVVGRTGAHARPCAGAVEPAYRVRPDWTHAAGRSRLTGVSDTPPPPITTPSSGAAVTAPIVLRRLSFADPPRWLQLGWRDFLRCPASACSTAAASWSWAGR